MSYVRRSSRILGRTPYLIGKIDVPKSVKIETTGEQIAVSGDLGTVRTDLSKLDTKGCSALKLLPEERQIAVACCDKEFFGTIQTLLKNSINVRSTSTHVVCVARVEFHHLSASNDHNMVITSKYYSRYSAGRAICHAQLKDSQYDRNCALSGCDSRILAVLAYPGHWLQGSLKGSDADTEAGLQP